MPVFVQLFRLFRRKALIGDGQQGKKGQGKDRTKNGGLEDDAEIGRLARIENGTQTIANAREHEAARDDAEKSANDINAERHAEKGRDKVDQPKGEDWHKTKNQKRTKRVLLKARLHLAEPGTGFFAQRIAERCFGDQEDGGRAKCCADDDEEPTESRAEHEPTGDRQHDAARYRKGRCHGINDHEHQGRDQGIVLDKAKQCFAVFA